VKIVDKKGQSMTVPNYTPGGLLRDTKVQRITPKSQWLRDLEARQKPLPKNAVKFPVSQR
jgi:hypothetical protein